MDNETQQSFNAMLNSANQFALTATNKNAIKRQVKANKEMADYNNEIALRNYEKARSDAYAREDQLNREKYTTDLAAKRAAGISCFTCHLLRCLSNSNF